MSGIGKKIGKFVTLWKNFGAGIAFGELKSSLAHEGADKVRADYVKHERVKKYLLKKYGYVVDKYRNMAPPHSEAIGSDAPIWIVWYQGEENAPETVRMCIESVRRHSGSHPVILLTRDSIGEYVKIPDHITEKLESGSVTLTHFSDILRFALLLQCGGIYLDATTLVTSDGAFCFDELPLYTCRTGIRPELDVAKGLWVSYIFAGGKGNGLASYMTEMFSEYWKKEDKLITYLLVDCAIALAYENIPWVREMIDSLPESNSEIYELEDNSRGPYSDDVYRRALSCPFHKMTYKRPHMCECADGTQTIYGRLTEDIKSGKL